jgi:hypothetical protein
MTEDSRDHNSRQGDSSEESQSSDVRSSDPNDTIAQNDLNVPPPGEAGIDWDESDAQTPVLATLVEPDADLAEIVRVGSPFAGDPRPLVIDPPIEVVIDGGPLRYTAMSAVAAAAMVLGFAAAAAWWFPAGGTMIAALGCVLSIFGLYSTYRYSAGCLLLLHLALFIVSYGRSIG